MSLFLVIDLCLSHNFIPIELREIIKKYFYSTATNDNEGLRQAIYDWCMTRDKASKLYGPISYWKTENVTDMSNLFCSKLDIPERSAFNDSLEFWDVSRVTTMSSMFAHCSSFNQPLDHWKVGQVEDMSFMFSGAYAFNQPLVSWDVSRVRKMNSMFQRARAFNQCLQNWDIGNVRELSCMFTHAASFNQPFYHD